MSDIVFVDGINIELKWENFWSVSFSEEFIDFYNKHKNEKGFLNTNLCFSKDKNKFYFKLNTWKPKKKEEKKEEKTEEKTEENIVKFGEEKIPF